MKGLTGVPAVQLTGCKVDYIVDFATNQLAKGYCVVIGLQSTGNSRTPLSPHVDSIPALTPCCVLSAQQEQSLGHLCAQKHWKPESQQTAPGR